MSPAYGTSYKLLARNSSAIDGVSWSNVTTQADPKDLRNLITDTIWYYSIYYSQDATRKYIWLVDMRSLTKNTFYLDYAGLPSDNHHSQSSYRFRFRANTSKFSTNEVVTNLGKVKSVTMYRRYTSASDYRGVSYCSFNKIDYVETSSYTDIYLNVNRNNNDQGTMRQHDANCYYVFNF